MGVQTYLWLKAIHILGFVTWIGSLVGAIFVLKTHVEQNAGDKLAGLEKRLGIAMDAGATIAIIAGLTMLFLAPGAPGVYLKGAGYFHAKLAAVVLLIGMHVVTRIRMRKLRNGDNAPLPGWVFPITELCLTAIVILVVVKPF